MAEKMTDPETRKTLSSRKTKDRSARKRRPGVIAVASAKGGTGKTTLCSALVVEASKEGQVAVLDFEPQGSLTLWWLMRGKPNNPRLIRDEVDPTDVQDAADNADWIFVDTSPGNMDQIERAIQAADLCLIPVQASAFDLLAARAVVSICGETGTPLVFVLNRENSDRPAINTSAGAHLRKLGILLEEHVQDRAAYVSALNRGLTGPEHPDSRQAAAAGAEIAQLWKAVKEALAKARMRHARQQAV
jgi:chromosome partitioning protein